MRGIFYFICFATDKQHTMICDGILCVSIYVWHLLSNFFQYHFSFILVFIFSEFGNLHNAWCSRNVCTAHMLLVLISVERQTFM